jgi:hypothetical protein
MPLKTMKKNEFEKEFEEEIKEWALKKIKEEDDFYSDYPFTPKEEYEDEIFTNNYEQYLNEFAEKKGIELI